MSEYDGIAPNFEQRHVKMELRSDCLELNVCRTCLEPSASIPIFSETDEDIGVMVVAIAGVTLQADDGLPTAVCVSCAGSLRTAYEFRLLAQQADRTLRQSRNLNDPNSFQRSTALKNEYMDDDDDGIKEDNKEITSYLEGDVLYHDPILIQSDVSVKEEEEENLSSDNVIVYDTGQQAQSKIELQIEQLEHSGKVANAGSIKRKRGRPRKQIHYPLGIPEHSVKETKAGNTQKKRGRPRKYICKPKCIPLTEQLDHSGKETNAVSTQKKKGKPRKDIRNPLCTPAKEQSEYAVQVKKAERKEKKKVRVRWLCELCGMVTPNSSHLRLHMRSHTGECPYICAHCGMRHSNRCALIVHLKRHTNEHSFYCDACGKGFYKKYDLIVHNRKHTGEKPFKCTQCERSFSIVYNMRAHMQRVHLVEKQLLPKENLPL